MCGEKLFFIRSKDGYLGSPPHVRGKAFIGFEAIQAGRITPACAGKSVFCPYVLFTLWDHPRMCGEKAYRKGV